MDETVQLSDGRTAAYAKLGRPGGIPVVYCHGAPGSRFEADTISAEASDAGFSLVGIDRPGYGASTPCPGRSINDWVPDALAVSDRLGLEQFYAVGTSTGGAYALALAASSPQRVLGVLTCCAMTDMRFEPARATMGADSCHALWDAPDRPSALRAAAQAFGEDGSRLLEGAPSALVPSDLELLNDPAYQTAFAESFTSMFAQGVVGYTDDRLADGRGWDSFDVGTVSSPVTVLHGRADRICNVINAEHTASIVPNARLSIHDDLGHLSISTKVIETLIDLVKIVNGPCTTN